jgi:hypothetical protein
MLFLGMFLIEKFPKEVPSADTSLLFKLQLQAGLLGSMPMRALAAKQPKPPLWNLSHKMAMDASALLHRY